ncbi:MAG: DUF2844 domain-containing protein [Pseudomonadota bacterium]
MNTRNFHSRPLFRAAACLALPGIALFAPTAHAALGSMQVSVESDARALRAVRQTVSEQNYTVEHLVLSQGTRVKEYVNAAGVVFAVTWHGRYSPNLTQLLGTYSDRARVEARAVRVRQGGVGPAAINDADLSVVFGGRMGSYSGRAWLPPQLPAGFNPASLDREVQQ